MRNLSSEIVKSIKEKLIKPIPHWQYLAKKFACWSLVALLIIFGALALALAIYIIQSIDWNVYSLLGYGSAWFFFMQAFPYLFILLLIIFLFAGYYFYRQTPKGHKKSMSVLTTILIFFGISLAVVLHVLGINREAYFQLNHMPFYHQVMFTKESEWSQPNKGLLWGEASNVVDSKFSLRDFNGKNWTVFYDSSTSVDGSGIAGENVKIIGRKLTDSEFQAKQIQRWDGVMNCNGQRNMMGGNGAIRGSGMMRGFGGGMMNSR